MEFSFTYLMILYSIFMVLGLVLQTYIGKKSLSSNLKAGWMKFIFFNLIIISLLLLFNFVINSITLVYIAISLGGIIELIFVTKKNKWKWRTFSIGFYLLLFALLIRSSVAMESIFHINILALVAVFDGFSQLGGKLLGKRKIASTISPNKTWEGFFFGTLATFCFGIGLYILENKVILNYLFLIPIFALTGDLLASLIKRKAKVKDFSNVIPYQGGFLDRFDSFTLTVVIIYIITNFI